MQLVAPMPRRNTGNSGARSGFILITAAIALIGVLALVGLAVDTGRLLVARNELQVFADEAAVAAAFELDGGAAGLTRARDAAAAGPGFGTTPNQWDFGTERVSGVQAQFAAVPAGPFDSNPGSAAGLRFVRVQANAALRLYFLPVVPGISSPRNIAAVSVAGQNPLNALGDGLAPFSPTAHDPAAPDFGFISGQVYTLRWAPPGQRDKADGSCAGDSGFDPGGSSDRGYIDVGQGSGASALRAAVINNSYFLPQPLTVGSAITMYSGQESVPSAMEQRYNQDTDVAAGSYAGYHGNGRRLLAVAVNGGGDPATVIGFAAFFLPPTPCGTKNTTPCCAEYVGAAVVSSSRKGAGSTGLYAVQLIQ